MVDLSVEFCGATFSNPVFLASGTPGWDGERLRRAAEAGFGGVVPKTICASHHLLQHPRCGRFALVRTGNQPMGMVNLELLSTIDVSDWVGAELPIASKAQVPLIPSILASTPSETCSLMAKLEETMTFPLLELNASCPVASEGMVGADAVRTYEIVRAAKEATGTPIMVKLNVGITDLAEVVEACEKAGADALCLANSIRGFAGVDIHTATPRLPAFGGYSGPAIKPVIQQAVAQTAMISKLPIAAVGGVRSWEDIVEYIMLGASVVQTCTFVMWNGPTAVSKLIEGLGTFMSSHGYTRLADMRGAALSRMCNVEAYAKAPAKHACVDESLCTACGRCEQVCAYDAIRVTHTAKVDANKCDGCGLCIEWCPVGSISLA